LIGFDLKIPRLNAIKLSSEMLDAKDIMPQELHLCLITLLTCIGVDNLEKCYKVIFIFIHRNGRKKYNNHRLLKIHKK